MTVVPRSGDRGSVCSCKMGRKLWFPSCVTGKTRLPITLQTFPSFLNYLFVLDCAGSFLPQGLSPSCGEHRLLSSCGVWASHCGGMWCHAEYASSRALRLQQWGVVSSRAQVQRLWCTGLAAVGHVGYSWTRDRTHVSCIGWQILYH